MMWQMAYGEEKEWRRVDYYMLDKAMQTRIEKDLEFMRPKAESSVQTIRDDIPKWEKDGMDAKAMANRVLSKGTNGLDEAWSIRCLKMLNQ